MSTTQEFQQARDLSDLRDRLAAAGYSRWTVRGYIPSVRRFLQYLAHRGIAIDDVDSSHVIAYQRHRLREYRPAHRRAPPSMLQWRSDCMSGISHFLRAALGSWPRPGPAQSPTEAIARSLLTEYRSELTTHTDLAPGTVVGMLEEGERFLEWCQERGVLFNGADLSLFDVDAYVELRAARLRRTTCKTMVKRLQRFLRFLHTIRRIPDDLSTRLIAPTLYHYESIPSILDPGQIDSVLECTRKDRSRKGRRDYAILMLLATYGLRAGEVVRLRLDDVDWRTETIAVFHSKTRTRSTLPLLPRVGEALLAYLRHARPNDVGRELFIRMKAPFSGLKAGRSLYSLVSRARCSRRRATAGKERPSSLSPRPGRDAPSSARTIEDDL